MKLKIFTTLHDLRDFKGKGYAMIFADRRNVPRIPVDSDNKIIEAEIKINGGNK